MFDQVQLKAREDTWEEAKRRVTKTANEFNKIQHKVLHERVAFYEKLALFDTGTIAATISMVAVLRQQDLLHWENVLFVGWSLLLLAMAVCLIRNSSAHAHLYYEASAHLNHAEARREQAGLAYMELTPSGLVNELGEPEDKNAYLVARAARAEDYKKTAQKLEKKSARRYSVVIWGSRLASSLTAVGVGCILVFAIKNLRSIPRMSPPVGHSTSREAQALPAKNSP